MTFLSRLKKRAQNHLSLSAKLFLKELVHVSKRGAWNVVSVPANLARWVEAAASARGFSLPITLSRGNYPLEPSWPQVSKSLSPSWSKLKITKTSAAVIQTSIIIPVFNRAGFTQQCLHSLLQEIDLNETEIIVVNNGSTDETEQLLDALRDVVRIVVNDANKGFVEACNQGASIATGEYLVFLNNDTTVYPGWLAYLLETIARNSSVGAVGSMFLYPDGSIQEAGAIVWKNGEAHHYGWGSSPADRQFNFAREVDYCSAASLLIKRDLFQRLGGFDPLYAPAYYEDIDLCMGVRSLGLKVVYQPMSRVVHYEGVTAGRDVTKGTKRFQIVNREKFVEKWRDVLEREHLEKDLRNLERAANRNRDLPRIIVFDERVPTPDRDAGSARMALILKALVKWSNVVFVPFYRPQGIEYEQALWKVGIETADAVNYRRLLRRDNVRAALVSRPSVAAAMIPRIRKLNRQIKIVFDMVDAHFIRLRREHEVGGYEHAEKEAIRLEHVETKLASASDLIWCNSSGDKQVMDRKIPGKSIEVIPTIHQISYDSGKPFTERQDLLFIGNLAHRPNEDAVHFFLQDIFPLILKSLPSVSLHVIGDNVSSAIAAYGSERVKIMGHIPDIEPFWQSSRIFVAPIRFGAGVKGKVGDAMAHGLPLVTTSIGAEGFGITSGVEAIVVDDPEGFASAVTQLYCEGDLWKALAENSRCHIEKYFTPQVIAETIDNSIKQTIAC